MAERTGPVVLVADGDPSVVRLTRLQLAEEGFTPVSAKSGRVALEAAADHPDLAIVATNLSDISGLVLIAQLRARGVLPIILLTDGCDVGAMLRGFEHGAADCVSKPFNPEELTARVRAVLRRYRPPPGVIRSGVLHLGDLAIDVERRTVRRGMDPVSLTAAKWRLLEVFCRNPGQVLSVDEILTQAWGPRRAGDVKFLRVWISRLRRKLDRDGQQRSVIRTYPAFGYGLDMHDSALPRRALPVKSGAHLR